MRISEDLRHLQTHLVDEFNKGKKMQDLYEMVQYAGMSSPAFQFLPLT
jgi:vacuolar protein sorting-associated protein 35